MPHSKEKAMKTRDEILRLLAMEKPELERRFKVRQLALFGSYVRGDQRADSDVAVQSLENDCVAVVARTFLFLGCVDFP